MESLSGCRLYAGTVTTSSSILAKSFDSIELCQGVVHMMQCGECTFLSRLVTHATLYSGMVPHMIIPLRRRGAVWEGAALVEGLRERDPAAVEAFFDSHVSHVRSVLYTVLGRDDEIPDLLQEVFLRALAGIGSLREPEKLQGWLSSIAVFVARGHIRSRGS